MKRNKGDICDEIRSKVAVGSFVILRFFHTFSNSFFPHNNYKLGRYPGTEWILHISSLLFLYIVLINSVFQFTPFYLKKTHIKSSFSMHFLFHKRVGRPPPFFFILLKFELSRFSYMSSSGSIEWAQYSQKIWFSKRECSKSHFMFV